MLTLFLSDILVIAHPCCHCVLCVLQLRARVVVVAVGHCDDSMADKVKSKDPNENFLKIVLGIFHNKPGGLVQGMGGKPKTLDS